LLDVIISRFCRDRGAALWCRLLLLLSYSSPQATSLVTRATTATPVISTIEDADMRCQLGRAGVPSALAVCRHAARLRRRRRDRAIERTSERSNDSREMYNSSLPVATTRRR